jgi:hypothetical protein
MADRVIFPQISGLNWPSHVLQAWLTLHELGVPDENIRFLPDIAHFSIPEITLEEVTEDPDHMHQEADLLTLRHPFSPTFDQANQRLIVSRVDPTEIRPRLKVSVRSETRIQFGFDAQGNVVGPFEQVVGRLAHFLPPLMAGLPSETQTPAQATEEDEKPLLRLRRQVCARYPELVKTLPPAVRDTLDSVAAAMERALVEEGLQSQAEAVREALNRSDTYSDVGVCRDAFLAASFRLTREEVADDVRRGALLTFRKFADTLFSRHVPPQQRQEETLRFCRELDPALRANQGALWRKLRQMMVYENQGERERIVLEMLEILTTQAFSAVAACDMLWGIGWAHGNLSDFRLADSPLTHDGTLLSITGGLQQRALLQSLLSRWAEQDAMLGVGRARAEQAAGRERLNMDVFDKAELRELWGLCAWRRETPDPILLLELALQRLVHPEAFVRMRADVDAHSTYGTLLAQPGATAVLGSRATLRYPGAILYIPLAEDVDEEAINAKTKIQIVKRLFLPACLRCEVLWQEAVARLDSPVYLKHDFQRSVRLADMWAALNPNVEEAVDPPVTG